MDFNDGSPGTKITHKQLAIIAGGLVVAIVVIALVIRWVQGDPNQSFEPSLKDQKTSIEKTCEGSENKDACINTLSGQAALQTGEVELCAQLEEGEDDGCVWEVAAKTKDPSTCDLIHNESYRQLCSDAIVYDLAIAAGDPGMCDKIKNETKRTGCRDGLSPVTADNCVELEQDVALCQKLAVSKQAAEKQDRRICSQLEGDGAQYCEERILVDDPDFDGLFTDQEIYDYKTDPDDADSDDDGYNDGDEVAAGYNPNGPGKLP